MKRRPNPYAAHVVKTHTGLCAACGETIRECTDVYRVLVGTCETGCTVQDQIEAHDNRVAEYAAQGLQYP